jgi:signal peptidase I
MLWVKHALFDICIITGNSMENTLLEGDIVFFTKYDRMQINRGDVLIIKEPSNRNNFMIKRCVALPKDTFFIFNSILYVNFEELNTPEVIKMQYTVSYPNKEQRLEPFQSLMERLNISYKEDRITKRKELKELQLTFSQAIALKKILGDENVMIDTSSHSDTTIIPYRTVQNTKNYYFVIGDNRSLSFDSRAFGPISEEQVIGKAKWILFSIAKRSIVRKERLLKKID